MVTSTALGIKNKRKSVFKMGELLFLTTVLELREKRVHGSFYKRLTD